VSTHPELERLVRVVAELPGWEVERRKMSVKILGPNGFIFFTKTHSRDASGARNLRARLRRAGAEL
jgi:hypothetical protein